MNKVLWFLLLLVFSGCGEEEALKEETLYLQEESKVWIPADSSGSFFLVEDSNGITQSYSMNRRSTDFTQSGTSVLGINKSITMRESIYQSYYSTYRNHFYLLLTAGFESYGDDITIGIGGTSFNYDFKFNTLTMVEAENEIIAKTITGKGFEEGDQAIFSTVEVLDSLRVGNTLYHDIMHFQLADFKQEWKDFTVTEIYLAKAHGLLKYKLKNGIEYHRK